MAVKQAQIFGGNVAYLYTEVFINVPVTPELLK